MSTPNLSPKNIGSSLSGFLQASIRNRLTAIVIGAAIIPVVLISIVLGWATYVQVSNALTKDAFDRLAAVQQIKVNQITNYLSERQGDMVTLRETTAALRQAAIAQREAINDLKSNQILNAFQVWDADVRDVASDPGVIAGVLALETGFEESSATQIRNLYLGRSDLQMAPDGSAYSTAHSEQHGFFTGYTAIHGYEDAFLIDAAGNIVYSTLKTDLFGTSLVSGPYKDSNLAGLYQSLKKTPVGQSVIADASLIFDKQAMFIGTPIYNAQALVGMLVYQLPLAEINAIVQDRTGLTPSAESFLVGKTTSGEIQLRSDRIVKQGVIGDPKPDTDAQAALAGESGSALEVGSTGVYELSVYAPLNIPGLNWAIATTSFANEVFVPQLEGRQKDYLTNFKENYGFYDIFLISADGFVFYTVAKEADFQTNILTGEYKDTNLGSLVREVKESRSFEFVDFAPYAPTGGKPAGFFAIPLLNEKNEIEMIVAAQASQEQLQNIMSETTGLGNTGETFIVGQDQTRRTETRFLADLGVESTILDPKFKVDTVASRSALAGESSQGTFTDYRGLQVMAVWSPVEITEATSSRADAQTWGLIAKIDVSESLAPVNQLAGTLGLVIGLAALLIGILSVSVGTRFATSFVNPIISLTNTAAKVAEGNLNLMVETQSSDEIGVLSRAFNSMTAQLREIIGSLEGRIAERTHSLELAAEVGRSVSQVRDLEILLHDATELIRSRFDLYYTQVYLPNPSRTELLLKAGTGPVGVELVGRGHKLPLNTNSINGRAAIERRSVVISDTAASPTFKPNPLLPDTRSEMAVPLLVADRVVGVLDLQSRVPGSLNQEILSAFEALAGQLAVAIQNANLLAETNEARAEVEKQARRLARAGWEDYLDAIHQPEHAGFIFEQNQVTPITEETQWSEETPTVKAPIAISGEPIGSLAVAIDAQQSNPRTAELITIVARQVSQQVENLRLLDSANRYRAEAEQTSRRATIEGWRQYLQSRETEKLSFMYDLREVKPVDAAPAPETAEQVTTMPIKIREESIGKLSVIGLGPDDTESISLINDVAERLSAHIESLRQFEETKRGQFELDQRARQLAAVAEVSTVSSRELDIQKMLQSVVSLTQRRFGLYHAHVFTYDERAKNMVIAACGWKEGDENEGTHGTTTIPLATEQSLVARAGRSREYVIANNVHTEPGWLPNPMLPETKSEMAVPLVIGEQLLGVLDVQSDQLNAFSAEDASIYTTLASQVATALQNAYSFSRAQQQAERESMLNTISQKIQSATTVEAVLQIAARELGHALGAPRTIAQLSMKKDEK